MSPTCALFSAMPSFETTPYPDQLPGTSGLRKRTKVFQQKNYLENFVQSIFNATVPQGKTLMLGGDGRFFSQEAGRVIIRMAIANGVKKAVVAQNYLMSTPAVSAAIREYKADAGGIIMTASHNPGGPEGDFGVKYNSANGGAAAESITNAIFEESKKLQSFSIHGEISIDTSTVGVYNITPGFQLQVIDSCDVHVRLLETVFNFDLLRAFVQRSDFSLCFDGMHGIGGPAARAIFVEQFGLPASSIMNGEPLPDFGGGHPDPNLTYAKELVDRMCIHKEPTSSTPDFGAAADGDADRNMILGKAFFVSPSDSVAIVAANAAKCIPYFKDGLKGVARSMPTSQALDRVANALGVTVYEVPTGWKFFGNLLDAGCIAICGEESFGTGSDHIREKDGMWAILAWLSILELHNRDSPSLVTVKDIVEQHWKTFGRNFYTRYDYENVEKEAADAMFEHLRSILAKQDWSGFPKGLAETIAYADEFTYTDPIDGSIASNQGLRFGFEDGSRIVFRLSGTGSVGATIRVYIEQYENDPSLVLRDAADALDGLVQAALSISQLPRFTGRPSPTVIT